MKISLNWINEYVDLNGVDVENLLNKFTLSVAEIEGVEYKGKDISGVVTAQIKTVNNHPKSEKLHILTVFDGKQDVQVVCGAPNVAEGMIVPFAQLGGKVGELNISVASIAGVESFGMCCSEKELGLSDENGGLMEFEQGTPLGVDIKTLLPVDDAVFEVDNKSLTNRPDLWGHYGIAREIAALLNKPLKPLNLFEVENNKQDISVLVKSKECYRYSAVSVDNVSKKVSPKAMQIKLFYTGGRSINLLTDITNYVMTELGQPMHAFDNDIVKSIEVLDLNEKTNFITLDEQTRELPVGTTVIAQNGNPLAIAGVMGGLNSGINDSTTKLLLESANFNGTHVRKTATALGMRSESSSRFEKTLDPQLTVLAIKRYLQVLSEVDGGINITSNLTDKYLKHYDTIVINTSKKYIDGYIGQKLENDLILDILRRLEFKVVSTPVENSDNFNYEITVPSHRATKDVSLACDIVEEVTRIYGYDNILSSPTLQKVVPVEPNIFTEREMEVKTLLATKYNLSEVHSTLWYDTKSNLELAISPNSVVSLVNALQKENSSIRQSIVPAMLKFVNENKKEYSDFGVFEIGSVATSLMTDQEYVKYNQQQGKTITPETLSGLSQVVNKNHYLGIATYSKTKNLQEMLLNAKNIVEYLFEFELNQTVELVHRAGDVELRENATDSEKYFADRKEYYHPKNNYLVLQNGVVVGEIATLHPNVQNNIDKKANVVIIELDFTAFSKIEKLRAKYTKQTKYPTTEYDFTVVTNNENTLYSEIKSSVLNLNTTLSYDVNFVGKFKNNETGIATQTIKVKVWSNLKTLTSEELDEFYNLVVTALNNGGFKLSE